MVDLEQFPIELLGHVFGFVEARDLYPSCFLISKRCLEAVKDEVIWEQRCKRELDVIERTDSGSWMKTFQGS